MATPTRRLTLIALLLALALALHQAERLLPFALPFPGVKPGLSNLVTILSLFLLPSYLAFAFVIVRSLLTAALGGFSGLVFSLWGGVLAFTLMTNLAYSWPRHFSLPGISVAAAIMHNLGQLMVAAVLSQTPALILYLPTLIIAGSISGFAIGYTGRLLLRALYKSGLVVFNEQLLPLIS